MYLINVKSKTTLNKEQIQIQKLHGYPANIYLFKPDNRNTTKSCEICSRLTRKIPERRQSIIPE